LKLLLDDIGVDEALKVDAAFAVQQHQSAFPITRQKKKKMYP